MKKIKLMSIKYFFKNLTSAALLFFFSIGCNNANNKTPVPEIKNNSVARIAIRTEQPVKSKKAPVINIMDTLSVKQLVLCFKDSAANSQRIANKLAVIYGVKLASIIKKNKLKVTGAPIAWYKNQKAPFFFEAGIPVDKNPSKLPAGVFIKQIGTDSVVVAHFYGPYDLTGQAYSALQDWIKDRNKKSFKPPYEVYVDDPIDKDGKLKDPYKVQTDIVFTWK